MVNKKWNYEKWLEKIRNNEISLCNIPKDYKLPELCEWAIFNDGMEVEYMPFPCGDDYSTYELCLKAVNNTGFAIKLIPQQYMSFNLQLAAVKQIGMALRYIPFEDRNYTLCWQAWAKSEQQCAWDQIPTEIKPLIDELADYRYFEEIKKQEKERLKFKRRKGD